MSNRYISNEYRNFSHEVKRIANLFLGATMEKILSAIRTTSSVERLNEEVRRRERVIRIFPNMESVIRLMGALLMEQDEKWAAGKKYLDMAEYLSWRKTNSAKIRRRLFALHKLVF